MLLRILLCFILCSWISACSVVAAANGAKEPDFSKIPLGSDQKTVERELGTPATSSVKGSETIQVYRYKLGDKPALGRAFGFALIDLVTFCLAEYVLFPVEIGNSGNAYDAILHFNKNGKVTKIIPKQDPSKREQTQASPTT